MIKWEYQIVSSEGDDPRNFVDELNKLGDDGWELAVLPPTDLGDGDHALLGIVKRPRTTTQLKQR